jgi:hypothetical protein
MKTTGRKSQEVYPERASSGGSGALVRVGYDGIVDEMEVVNSLTPNTPFLPRNSALDPMSVVFPDFTMGNTLEVDFRLNSQSVSMDEPGQLNVSTTIQVSVDGGVTFYTLVPSASLDRVDTAVIADPSILLRSLDAITIVDPMPVVVDGIPGTTPVTAPPIVRVYYFFSDATATMFLNGSVDEPGIPGAILKCSELAAGSVFQGPLGQLALETPG